MKKREKRKKGMTAKSELFCKELVLDAVEMLFEENLPEYDHIEIENKWKGIRNQVRYPKKGTIILKDKDDNIVAKVKFKVHLVAEPKDIELELPNKEKYRWYKT